MSAPIPVALFAYRRPDLLARTLAALRANNVKLLYAFSDGPRADADAPQVDAVRAVLRAVDWAEVHLTERPTNAGLGASIVGGVTSVLAQHDAVMVSEDDLFMVPGTVAWVTAALQHYRDYPNVSSVSAWTHPRVTPRTPGVEPHFSRRFSGLFFGTWARAWKGMDIGNATDRLQRLAAAGGDPAEYGVDIPAQASVECERNLWAARFIANDLVERRLSVCPPWTMVQHIGYDPRASNAATDAYWDLTADRTAPPIPQSWPEPVEHPDVAKLWRDAADAEVRAVQPPSLLQRVRRKLGRWFG